MQPNQLGMAAARFTWTHNPYARGNLFKIATDEHRPYESISVPVVPDDTLTRIPFEEQNIVFDEPLYQPADSATVEMSEMRHETGIKQVLAQVQHYYAMNGNNLRVYGASVVRPNFIIDGDDVEYVEAQLRHRCPGLELAQLFDPWERSVRIDITREMAFLDCATMQGILSNAGVDLGQTRLTKQEEVVHVVLASRDAERLLRLNGRILQDADGSLLVGSTDRDADHLNRFVPHLQRVTMNTLHERWRAVSLSVIP